MLVIFTLCLINYLKKTNLKDTSYSNINSNKDNMAVTITAVVVKVNEICSFSFNKHFLINIPFTINENGEITVEEPEISM